jgi:PIN domain nuclease of toxin-antitoxin system
MKILIDTHIFLWAISDPDRISDKWRIELESQANIILVSSVSIAEIMIKASIGKLEIDFDPLVVARESGFEMLDFKGEDALLLKELPFHHKDPFDRMLIAQGIQNRIKIMTDDSKFQSYECRLVR